VSALIDRWLSHRYLKVYEVLAIGKLTVQYRVLAYSHRGAQRKFEKYLIRRKIAFNRFMARDHNRHWKVRIEDVGLELFVTYGDNLISGVF